MTSDIECDDDEGNQHGESQNIYDDPYYIDAMIQIVVQETGSYWP
ncbi:hypothetical protein [Polaromonas sp.]|nr:hypothetical protein [Polaromonas sp.]